MEKPLIVFTGPLHTRKHELVLHLTTAYETLYKIVPLVLDTPVESCNPFRTGKENGEYKDLCHTGEILHLAERRRVNEGVCQADLDSLGVMYGMMVLQTQALSALGSHPKLLGKVRVVEVYTKEPAAVNGIPVSANLGRMYIAKDADITIVGHAVLRQLGI